MRKCLACCYFGRMMTSVLSQKCANLSRLLRVVYRYETQVWKISSSKPSRELKHKIIQFLEDSDAEENLLIVYYAGHAQPHPRPGESPVWLSYVGSHTELSVRVNQG